MTIETILGLGRLWFEYFEKESLKPRQDEITKDHVYIKDYLKWKKDNPDKEIILLRRSKRVKKEHFEIVNLKKSKPEPKEKGKKVK